MRTSAVEYLERLEKSEARKTRCHKRIMSFLERFPSPAWPGKQRILMHVLGELQRVVWKRTVMLV